VIRKTVVSVLLLYGMLGSVLALASASASPCSNETERTGTSAALPDCRAYELVTPPTTNGRYVTPISTLGFGAPWDLFPTELASPSTSSMVFLAYSSALEEPAGGTGVFDLYGAERSSTGWKTTRRYSPSGAEAVRVNPGGVSGDHRYAFINVEQLPGLPSGPLSGNANVGYLSKPNGTFELIGKGQEATEPYAQGRYISSDGEHIIFITGKNPETQSVWCQRAGSSCEVNKLAPDAPPAGTGAVYDRSPDGATHVVSLLPSNEPPAAGEQAFYKGVSKDGTTVAFMIGETLYARVDNAATLKVAEGEPVFAGISTDGRYLFYVAGGESGTIHRYDVQTAADVEVNPTTVAEVVNVSADGSHVYFISKEEVGGEGAVGEPNMFVWREDSSVHLVATVEPSDLIRTSGDLPGFPALNRWTSDAVNPSQGTVLHGPGGESSRTTPNGSVLIFESRARLTGYDNTGHTEIYRYDDEDEHIICVSCNFGLGEATGEAQLENLHMVPTPILIHNLTDDGSRVFFETGEPLVEEDTDGVNDIYEWQADGERGTVGLISSGKSIDYPLLILGGQPAAPTPNIILSITPDGKDVDFLSEDELVREAGTGGVPAIYDARVNGGFPVPPPIGACAEEACRPLSDLKSPGLQVQPSENVQRNGNAKNHRKHHCSRSKKHKNGSKAKKHQCGAGKPTKKKRAAAAASSASPLLQTEGSGTAAAPAAEGDAPSDDVTSRSAVNAAAEGEFAEFGIESADAVESTSVAGGHPDFTTRFVINHLVLGGLPRGKALVKSVSISLPPGLLGNPNSIPKCSTAQLDAYANCPIDSQVGVTKVAVDRQPGRLTEPIYNLVPPHPDDEIARLGFLAVGYPVFIDLSVRTAGDYEVVATVHDAPGLAPLLESEAIIWGNPADESHDPERLTAKEALDCTSGTACEAENGERPSGIPVEQRKAFMTNPSACQEGVVDFDVTSYQLPSQVFHARAPLPTTTQCVGLPFAPTFNAEPTSHVAGAPTGLKSQLVLPQHLGTEERATATMREARVTLPAGMQVAAGAANWIGTCSDAQVGYHEEVDAACPDNSKLGTATIISPALSTAIEGTIYQRSPQPGHQLGLWLTADALGLHVKLPGELEPDKETGRLTAVFRDLPQVPVEEIDLNVWGGPRAPLENPDHCGTFTTSFSFSPHSNDPAATGQSQMQITEGCDQGFSPTLHAGVTEPTAGKFSPFVFDLNRDDGQQALRGFELKLPDGELAKLKGVPLCNDADAAAAYCPAGSRIGSLTATTGPGPEPFTLPEPGKAQPQIYLAGPYQGSPFSILSEVPAQAGPFNLGTLAVRNGLDVEPETGRAVVKADPLPQFFEGVGIAYRHLHAVIDRPEFNINPTDCRELAVTSDVTSTLGTAAHPQARFQVDGCKRLKFKPKLSLMLKGGTKRAQYPALTAVLRAHKGDANIAFTSVALPHSEFLAQEHIGTICTRKQFAADECPKGSVYGNAKAFTSLLDKPLSGPVYLRSSDHPLPDLVAKLGGQLEIDLVGRIDSVHGGIRATFESVPDAPVSKFVLRMKGGRKSLLTNSTDICDQKHRAAVRLVGQNGRERSLRAPLAAAGCGRKANND
jgi:hypothetical protein